MVGVAVAMVISKMRENHAQIGTMHGNLKKVPKFSHSHISQSQWWICGRITVINFFSYQNYTTQLFRTLFLENWARILFWFIIDFIKNYRHIIYKTDYSNYLQSKYICVHMLCRFSNHYDVTKALLCPWPTEPCVDFLQWMIRHLPLWNFACKFPLRNVSKPNNSGHNRI